MILLRLLLAGHFRTCLFFPEIVVDDCLRQEISIDLIAAGLEVSDPVHHDHACGGALAVGQTLVNNRVVVGGILSVGVGSGDQSGVPLGVVDCPAVVPRVLRGPVHEVADGFHLDLRLIDMIVVLNSKRAFGHAAGDHGSCRSFLRETPS